VFNLVTGTGAQAGEALVKHPGVDMISFTGSTRAGKRISELASQSGEERRARARRQERLGDPGRRDIAGAVKARSTAAI
jgi:hypothetical protein